MPMLGVYGHYKSFTLAVRFTLSDVRIGRLENRRETLSFTSSLLLKFNNISFHFMTDIIAQKNRICSANLNSITENKCDESDMISCALLRHESHEPPSKND